MNLIFNELSLEPLSQSVFEIQDRFSHLLNSFKVANDKYSFNRIVMVQHVFSMDFIAGQNINQVIGAFTDRDVQQLLLGLIQKPYADDLEAEDIESFLQGEYLINSVDKPTDISPMGLPISYILSVPCLSLCSHEFWKQEVIIVQKTIDGGSIIELPCINIGCNDNLNSPAMVDWAANVFTKDLTTKADIEQYLNYNKYSLQLSDSFLSDLWTWKKVDPEKYIYILKLMKDVEIHPFTGGMGKTENLRGRDKEASKRITQKDRLSYSVENDEVTYFACKGHYDFH